MRVTGGIARGVLLRIPSRGVRPATDRLREAVFSRLGHTVVGKTFLDLFAGSGAYGLEALSRGSTGGHFVERNRRVLTCLKANLDTVCKSLGGASPSCRVCEANVFQWQPRPAQRFDFIFIDLPYTLMEKRSDALFTLAVEWLSHNPQARLVFEMPAELELTPSSWALERRLGKARGRGEPTVAIYKKCLLE